MREEDSVPKAVRVDRGVPALVPYSVIDKFAMWRIPVLLESDSIEVCVDAVALIRATFPDLLAGS